MATRVLAHPVAKERIVQLRALLAGGFIESIQQLLAHGDELATSIDAITSAIMQAGGG
jgi:hypothetical protein